MDPVGKTKFGVLAIGSAAAALILWLSVSFWLDAWRQHEDAQQLRHVAALEDVLVDIARDIATERAVTLALLGAPRLDDLQAPAPSTHASLQGLRERIDVRLDTVLASVRNVIDEPALAGRLRHSPIVLESALDALAETRGALDRHRALESWPVTDAARGLAMRQTFALGSRLVERLHVLQSGLGHEPRTAVRSITELRRLKMGLRDFAESVARASALSHALSSPFVTHTASARHDWGVTPSEAMIRVRADIDRLRLHEREQTIEPSLLADLGALIAVHERSAADARGNGETRQRVADLDSRIGQAIAGEATAVEAHGRRRLVIDTLLILTCFWIVFASLRLLRNIQHQAWHDRLTGRPNRFRFERLLELALSKARDEGGTLAVIVLDVDNFKVINESVGHDLGDALLRRLADRLAACLAPQDTLAALGGDEFAVIAASASSTDAALGVAEKLRAACEVPFEIDGVSLSVTLSLGICVPSDADPDEDTDAAPGPLRRADIAMRQAKDGGRDQARLFCHALAERNRARIRLEIDLRQAIAAEQLELHYQPKIGTRSGRVDGLEALVRWRHPERGLVSPADFVPLAESCGLISAIGAWVLEEAIRQTVAWHRDGHDALHMAVNVSALQFVEEGFVERVERTLAAHGLSSRHLELEVTESVGMMDIALVAARLEQLRALGISIALDDFGTDYSSLQYLQSLPLDNLKIDRSFVSKLDGDDRGRSLAPAIVLMAKSLDLKTVAEGVETFGQLERVIALGCDYVQGYYYSKPVPAEEVPATISRIETELARDNRRAA